MMPTASDIHVILSILKEWGGYFVFTDEDGKEFVITSKDRFEQRRKESDEKQLSFSARSMTPSVRSFKVTSTANELLERINREIALFQIQKYEEELEQLQPEETMSKAPENVPITDDDLSASPPAGGTGAPTRPPLRVRFEPLRGDLPPELQE